jgi:hypothetical protein
LKPSFRFSLLTVALLMAIVGLSLALFLSQTRLRKLEAESKRLKDQFGELTITDPSQVHVIAVPTPDAMHRRWRVYLPGGHDFGIYPYRGSLDAKGLPPPNAHPSGSRIGGKSSPREPREILIDVSLGKSIEGEPCLWISENGGGGSPLPFYDSKLPSWANGESMLIDRVAAMGGKTKMAPVANPLVLLSLDTINAAGNRASDAVLIWIGPYEKISTKSLHERGVLP